MCAVMIDLLYELLRGQTWGRYNALVQTWGRSNVKVVFTATDTAAIRDAVSAPQFSYKLLLPRTELAEGPLIDAGSIPPIATSV